MKIVASSDLRDSLSSVYIRVDYDEADITARGIDESTLRLYLWDVSTGGWDLVAGSVNTTGNFLEGTVDHLSEYGTFGSAPATPAAPSPGGGGGGGGRRAGLSSLPPRPSGGSEDGLGRHRKPPSD